MKGVILIGGYGKRLRPLTWFKPKCMVRINGRPVLEHIINYLKKYGVDEIFVNLHYKPKQIMDYFGTSLVYTYEPKLLGEEGTIRSLHLHLRDDWCVVVNGDTLTNMDLGKMFRLSGGRNIKYMDKGVYAGIRIIPPNYLFQKDNPLIYEDTQAFWIDMGTFEGLRKAREVYKSKNEEKSNTLS